jgi:hypothetical protein
LGNVNGNGVPVKGQAQEELDLGDVAGIGVPEEIDEEAGGLQGDVLGGGILTQVVGNEPALGGLFDEAPFNGQPDRLPNDPVIIVGVGHLRVSEGLSGEGVPQGG